MNTNTNERAQQFARSLVEETVKLYRTTEINSVYTVAKFALEELGLGVIDQKPNADLRTGEVIIDWEVEGTKSRYHEALELRACVETFDEAFNPEMVDFRKLLVLSNTFAKFGCRARTIQAASGDILENNNVRVMDILIAEEGMSIAYLRIECENTRII